MFDQTSKLPGMTILQYLPRFQLWRSPFSLDRQPLIRLHSEWSNTSLNHNDSSIQKHKRHIRAGTARSTGFPRCKFNHDGNTRLCEDDNFISKIK